MPSVIASVSAAYGMPPTNKCQSQSLWHVLSPLVTMQSRDYATVSKLGHFLSLLDAPVDSATYSNGHVSDLVSARNLARMLPREAEFVSE